MRSNEVSDDGRSTAWSTEDEDVHVGGAVLRSLTAALLLAIATGLCGCTHALRPHVLIVTAISLEAQPWIDLRHLKRRLTPDLLGAPIVCDDVGAVCVLASGSGKANGLAALLSTGMSSNIDLSSTYVVVTGIAGISPKRGTIGDPVWVRRVIDYDLAYEIDPREGTSHNAPARFPLGCGGEAWCDHPATTGTEAYALDPIAVAHAQQWSSAVPLTDADSVQRYRLHFPWPQARAQPHVITCDETAGDAYWQGTFGDAFASDWVAGWTNGAGEYCVSAMEDTGYAEAMNRLARVNRARWDRFLILRSASDFDEPFPGQSALTSLVDGHRVGGAALAAENGVRAATPVIDRLAGTVQDTQSAH
jgi:purine nucleoside permease